VVAVSRAVVEATYDMADGDGNLHRQVGEILGAVRGLTTQLQEFKRDAERREDRLSEEISEVRGDTIKDREALIGRLEALVAQVRDLAQRSQNITSEVSTLKQDVKVLGKLEEPVHQLDELRKRLVRYGLLIASVIGIVWSILSGPVSSVMSKLINKMLGTQ
jgi:predicted nuclease with TOPRIM domain